MEQLGKEAGTGKWWRVGRGSGVELLLWISGFTTRESEQVTQFSAPLYLTFKLGVGIVPTCAR